MRLGEGQGLAPGSTIGIIGGGQLGRMLSIAAAQLGYRCHIFDPHEAPCAAEVAARFTRGSFDDADALARFAAQCDVVTYEFENLPISPLEALGDKLRPGTHSLTVTQDRAVEKRFLDAAGVRIAPWSEVNDEETLAAAIAALGLPLLLKTRRFGYDGKGQAWVRTPAEAAASWQAIGRVPAVAEKAMQFAAEYSVIAARSAGGQSKVWPVSRNIHDGGILRRSEIPAGAPIEAQVTDAVEIAATLAERLGHVGVMAVEFFACSDGPVVNEIAPRVHNSGHWTIEGSVTSQFEQHVRAICGLPLRDTRLVGRDIVMENLIGGDVDQWDALTAQPGAHVHLYNKGEPRPDRKMGHVTRVA
ncbi:MAG: 5-(carboxyamino)imidazole ribonucleotide synthase [Pseudomonadota bacterium]|nr:5-(carboxyamino)imidazole ribonucleotide synthase [Pseudomonadota bacterium]